MNRIETSIKQVLLLLVSGGIFEILKKDATAVYVFPLLTKAYFRRLFFLFHWRLCEVQQVLSTAESLNKQLLM